MSGAGDDDCVESEDNSAGSDGVSAGSGEIVTMGTASAPGGREGEEDRSASEEAQV